MREGPLALFLLSSLNDWKETRREGKDEGELERGGTEV